MSSTPVEIVPDHADTAGPSPRLVDAARRIANRPATGSALSPVPGDADWTADQVAALEARGMIGLPPGALRNLKHVALTTGLDPFRGEIMVIRIWNRMDDGTKVAEFPVIVSYPTMRAIAQSTREYDGMQGPEFTGDGVTWSSLWLGTAPPVAGRVRVNRKGQQESDWTIIYWDETVPLIPVWEVRDGKRYPTDTMAAPARWQSRPRGMFSKCVVAAGLRSVFPEVSGIGGMYIAEEMERAQQHAANADAESVASAERKTRRDTVAGLVAAGRGVPEVIAGTVVGDLDGKATGLAGEARDRITRARAGIPAVTTVPAVEDEEEDQRRAWLWEEIQHAVSVMGDNRNAIVGRPEKMWGKPLDEWTSQQMVSVMGPLRWAVARRMITNSRRAEGMAYQDAGPHQVAPLAVLLGQADS